MQKEGKSMTFSLVFSFSKFTIWAVPTHASAIQHLINKNIKENNDDDDKENRPLFPNFPKYPNHYEKCVAIKSKLYLKWLANKTEEDPAAAEMARKTSPLHNNATLTHVIIIVIC